LPRRISWYHQVIHEDGEPGKLVSGKHINLDKALILLASLPRTVPGSRGEIRGFLAEDESFLEFMNIGNDEFQVRYENPKAGIYRMGLLSYQKAREMLTDFFTGERPRWLNELEPY